MKSLRNHFSVIFPLMMILLSLQFSIVLGKIVKEYEKKLTDDYNIIVVSSTKLKEEEIKKIVPDLSSLTLMSAKKILKKLKRDMSSKNLSLLQVALPKFYSVKLNSFPNAQKIANIAQKLRKLRSVTKVETFSQTHSKIYNIFLIAKTITYIFTTFIFIISLLLILKQMKIWVYEHKERMEIMSLFGAPFWMKSVVLYRLALVDSIIATIVVVLIFYTLPFIGSLQEVAAGIGIHIPHIGLLTEAVLLFIISLLFALLSVSVVMIKVGKKD